ncbi:MAG TPA: Hsp33 family molecular chaperone HslO [Nevskiaceae bacterium]|nr:Hsp33 family molecular chaperone HslO [Nevskiaceae bacterium]
MRDALAHYLFTGHAVRAALVDVHAGLADMLDHRAYAPGVRQILGEALAAAPLLASHLKFEGRISLQYQGDEQLSLLVVQIDDQLTLRGMAKTRVGADGSFATLVHGGRLSVLLEPKAGTTRYEGIVPLTGGSLAQALEGYYAQSEQLATRLCLAADAGHLRGLLLQRLPATAAAQIHDEAAYWERVETLFATLTPAELLAIEPETVMHRLFHAEDLTAFPARTVTLACHCSRASVSQLILALGEHEADQLLAERDRVEVTCEFCGRTQRYSPAEVHALFAAQRAAPSGALPH